MQAVAKSQKIKKSTSTKVFYVICYTFVELMALVCLLPFIMVVSGSFSSEQARSQRYPSCLHRCPRSYFRMVS